MLAWIAYATVALVWGSTYFAMALGIQAFTPYGMMAWRFTADSGLPASTPVAIVQHVSLPQQRQVITRLDALSQTLAEHQLGSPSIIVVGDVIKGVALASAPQADPLAPLRFSSHG
mgnify:CR=1 FL=1